MKNISAVILVKNAEQSIERTIRSVLFCNEILVINDESTDKTVQVIEKLVSEFPDKKIRIKEKALHSEFSEQRNWTMEQVENKWILFIDADEVITSELAKEIETLPDENCAYAIPRIDIFWDKKILFGEVKKARIDGIIRLIPNGFGKWRGVVHEVFQANIPIKRLKNHMFHYAHSSISQFISKINLYSSLRALELKKQGKKTNIVELLLFPFGKFVYTYFILFGLLDGPAGFVYSFIMAFHSFLVRAKLMTIHD